VGRGFVLDSDSGDKGIDDVNGYRWAEWSRSPEACDDQQELDFHGLEKLTLQHVIIDGDLCSLPNRDGGIESQEGHRLKTPRNTTKNVVHGVQQDERRRRLAYWFTKEDIEPWRSVNLDLPLCVFLLDASEKVRVGWRWGHHLPDLGYGASAFRGRRSLRSAGLIDVALWPIRVV
jgi:hypothetical protein